MLVIGITIFLILILFSGCTDNNTNKSSSQNGGTNNNDNSEVSSIQGLIDAASEGDTINIPSGTYNEHIIINKTIHLIGEDKETTIIDPDGDMIPITIDHLADGSTVSGFTIKNSKSYSEKGIYIKSDNCEISNNIVTKNDYAIYVYMAQDNTIKNNQILDNMNSGVMIRVCESGGNIISNNYFSENSPGIYLSDSSNNDIYENTFDSNYGVGVRISCGDGNKIYRNNFQSNDKAESTCSYDPSLSENNNWDNGIQGNYWNDYTGADSNGDGKGDTSHTIPGDANNIDRYPLIEPLDL